MKTGNYVYFIFALCKIVNDSISTHPRCEAQSQMESGNVRATGTLRRPMGTKGEPDMQCNVFEDYEQNYGDRHQILAKSAPQKVRNPDKAEFATKVPKSS